MIIWTIADCQNLHTEFIRAYDQLANCSTQYSCAGVEKHYEDRSHGKYGVRTISTRANKLVLPFGISSLPGLLGPISPLAAH